MLDADDLAKRRKDLSEHPPKCPLCGTTEVALVYWPDIPAWWRCRECGQNFRHEPKEDKLA